MLRQAQRDAPNTSFNFVQALSRRKLATCSLVLVRIGLAWDRGCCRTRVRSEKMQGEKLFLDKEVVCFRLSERVRPHKLYRRLAEWVD